MMESKFYVVFFVYNKLNFILYLDFFTTNINISNKSIIVKYIDPNIPYINVLYKPIMIKMSRWLLFLFYGGHLGYCLRIYFFGFENVINEFLGPNYPYIILVYYKTININLETRLYFMTFTYNTSM